MKNLPSKKSFFPSKLGNLIDKFNFSGFNKSNTKETNLKNSSMEQNNVQGNQTIVKEQVNNYYIKKEDNSKKNRKGNFNKFKSNIKNNKIVVIDKENNFPEKELLIKYGFKNIVTVNSIKQLKEQKEIGAVIYRYRKKVFYEQIEKEEIKKVCFVFNKKQTKIINIKKYKADDNLDDLVDYMGKVNIPLFVYSYPEKVEDEDWNILTSYYFVVFANFPLMLVNHLKNILIIHEKI